jgi:hypothetical protein
MTDDNPETWQLPDRPPRPRHRRRRVTLALAAAITALAVAVAALILAVRLDSRVTALEQAAPGLAGTAQAAQQAAGQAATAAAGAEAAASQARRAAGAAQAAASLPPGLGVCVAVQPGVAGQGRGLATVVASLTIAPPSRSGQVVSCRAGSFVPAVPQPQPGTPPRR